MKKTKKKDIQDAKNNTHIQWLIASVVIPLLAIITTLIIYFLSRPINEPKFIIANGIINSNATIKIKANNIEANQKKNLDIMFDTLTFPLKGVLDKPDSKGMYQWSFALKKYTSAKSLTKDGEHKIKVAFPGRKWSNTFGILFLSNPPIVSIEKSNTKGRTSIKGNVTTQFQVPKNILSVEITYFNDKQACIIKNIPLETKVHPETGITYYEFSTVLQGLPIFKKDDIRYSNPFWKVEVKDQAGNKYHHQQSYAKFMAPGCDVVGVGNIANIKIEKLSEGISNQLKNIVRIVPNPLYIYQLPNGKPPIDLTIRSQENKTILEWSYNIEPIVPLTLIYKNEKKIGASASNKYIDNSVEPTAKFRVEQEFDNKIYSSKTKSIEIFDFQSTRSPINTQYFILLDKSNSMWMNCNNPDQPLNSLDFSKLAIYKKVQSIYKINSKNKIYLMVLDSKAARYSKQIESINDVKKILEYIKPGGKTTIGDRIEWIRKQVVENIYLKNIEIHIYSDMEETAVGKISKEKALSQLFNSLRLKHINIYMKTYVPQCKNNKFELIETIIWKE